MLGLLFVCPIALLTLPVSESTEDLYHGLQKWPPVTMRYARPTAYPCMEDWNKVCVRDSDCCSGVCMTYFCKVEGVDVTTAKKKRPRITINISK